MALISKICLIILIISIIALSSASLLALVDVRNIGLKRAVEYIFYTGFGLLVLDIIVFGLFGMYKIVTS